MGWGRGVVFAGGLADCAAVHATSIHADGFETPCIPLDADADRLSGCEESALQLDPSNADTDGDGLSDGNEVLGTLAGLDLPALGVDPRRKDILLEYDWYVDASEAGSTAHCPASTSHSHRPLQASLDIVTAMFADAPVSNPDGTTGINIIHDVGQGAPFTGGSQVFDPDGDGILPGDTYSAQFDAHYSLDFAQNRRGYFHYVLLPHRYLAPDNGLAYSGIAELTDGQMRDEFIVSLYCQRSVRNVAHTIAHELGHNLGLHHGGDDDCNHKPNYNSIMNYRYQFPGVDIDCDVLADEGPADFSSGNRAVLDENALDERTGVCGGVPFDWNGANGIEPLVQADINAQAALQPVLCGGVLSVLSDHDDWSNAVIDMTPTGTEQGNVPPPDFDIVKCPPPPEEFP